MTSLAMVILLVLGGSAAVATIAAVVGLAFGLNWWQALKDTIAVTMVLPKG